MRPKDLWKRLMVKFRGEEGLDYGGVARYIYIQSSNRRFYPQRLAKDTKQARNLIKGEDIRSRVP